MLTLAIQEMSTEFPTLMETLVHERDKYMAYQLLRIASEHSSVVAVVGRGHLQGIKKNWNQTINVSNLINTHLVENNTINRANFVTITVLMVLQIKELMELPTNESIFTVKNILKYMVVVVVGTAIVSGMYLAK
jgi:pheromone shutdown protein TraB